MVTLPYSSPIISRLHNTASTAARKLIRPFTWTSALQQAFSILTERTMYTTTSTNTWIWMWMIKTKVTHVLGFFEMKGLLIINYNTRFEPDLIFQRWTKFWLLFKKCEKWNFFIGEAWHIIIINLNRNNETNWVHRIRTKPDTAMLHGPYIAKNSFTYTDKSMQLPGRQSQ